MLISVLLQACLREIHTKLLRKHLQRLEHPLEAEDNLASDDNLKPSEEIIEEDDVEGWTWYL